MKCIGTPEYDTLAGRITAEKYIIYKVMVTLLKVPFKKQWSDLTLTVHTVYIVTHNQSLHQFTDKFPHVWLILVLE